MDIKHYYIEQGDGFPLILLHGNGEDSSYFVHQMEPFAQYFRMMAIDILNSKSSRANTSSRKRDRKCLMKWC